MDLNLFSNAPLGTPKGTVGEVKDFVETIEHLHATSYLSEAQWLDLLQVSWKDYYSFKAKKKELPLRALENICQHFGLAISELLQGQLNFQNLSIAQEPKKSQMPEQYLLAAHGRLRSTITSVDFLEKNFGWRLKTDVLRKFGLHESTLLNAFDPISIRLITEICEYLSKRQFTAEDFFNMGVHSYQGNKDGLLAKFYADIFDYKDAFEALANMIMPLFEQNCDYTYERLSDGKGLLTMKSNSDVAHRLGVKALGNSAICNLKGGILASTALYFGRNIPKVTHPKCEHRGDNNCQYVIDFSYCSLKSQNSLSDFQPAHIRN